MSRLARVGPYWKLKIFVCGQPHPPLKTSSSCHLQPRALTRYFQPVYVHDCKRPGQSETPRSPKCTQFSSNVHVRGCAIGERYHTYIIPFHIRHVSNMCRDSGMSEYNPGSLQAIIHSMQLQVYYFAK